MSDAKAERAEDASPDRRRRTRTHVPSIELHIDGGAFTCTDWGLGGCRITGYEGPLRPGDETTLELNLRIGKDHSGLPVGAEILRHEPETNNGLAMRFTNLDASRFEEYCRAVESELRSAT